MLEREQPRAVIHDEEFAGMLERADVPLRLLAWTDTEPDADGRLGGARPSSPWSSATPTPT